MFLCRMFVVVVSFNFHMKFHSRNFQGDEFFFIQNLSFLTILFYFDGYKKKCFGQYGWWLWWWWWRETWNNEEQ